MDEPDRQIDLSGKDKEQADLLKQDKPSEKQVISKEDEPSEKQAVSK